MRVCFLAMKKIFLYKNCVCVQTKLWKGWGEKEACLKGLLTKGRLSHTLTSAARSPSIPAQRESLVMGATGGGTGTHCLKWPFWCNVSQLKQETSQSQQRTSRGFWAALPTSSAFFCSCGSIFFQTHGKIEEEIQALHCIFSEAKGLFWGSVEELQVSTKWWLSKTVSYRGPHPSEESSSLLMKANTSCLCVSFAFSSFEQ